MASRADLAEARRWVIKIGSAMLTADGHGLDERQLQAWAAQIAALRAAGKEVVLVSSGAVAEGMARLGWANRPELLAELQAIASVGQAGLVEAYARAFADLDLQVAQVLLTHDDVAHRERYLNSRRTIRTLLELGIVPIINENDAISMAEIRLGDNDTLAALAVNLLEAEALVIMTDQTGVYDADPRVDPKARQLDQVQAHAPELLDMASSKGGALGTGGMQTKIRAARQAAQSGAMTIIANGLEADLLPRLVQGESLGTVLLPRPGQRRAARKNWLAGQQQICGYLHVDAGAARVLQGSGGSLLPVGVTRIEGEFHCGDLVACIADDGSEIARGLCNYEAHEARRLMGKASQDIITILGYERGAELIHRDNLVVIE